MALRLQPIGLTIARHPRCRGYVYYRLHLKLCNNLLWIGPDTYPELQ